MPENKAQASLADYVQGELERLILGGTLHPGDQIKERDFAEALGVSRGPVREACRVLQRARLVDIFPNRGVFVREVKLSDATDVFDIRAELSGIVAREAVNNISPRVASSLASLIDRMDEAATALDADAYLPLNLEFHKILYGLADNCRVAKLDRDLGNELLVYRRRGLASGGGLAVSNDEHREILAALVGGDAEKLERLLKKHISGGKDRFLAAIGTSLPDDHPSSDDSANAQQERFPEA